VSGYAIVVSAAVSTNSATAVTNTATCPVGKKAIGGGFAETSGNSMHVLSEGPTTVTGANDSWTIKAQRIQANNATFTVTAICVSAL
jgi:hypothetical protein